jgi:hypothetical protein
MLRALLPLCALAGCAPAGPSQRDVANAPDRVVARMAARPIDRVMDSARAAAITVAPPECSKVAIPDSAFVPIEVTGGGEPEYAVFFAHATCDVHGEPSASAFIGSGGGKIQIWSASAGSPRLLFDHSMHGFTPTPSGFVSVQHGGFCLGGAGPGVCVVSYEWNAPSNRFEVRGRRLYDDRHPGTLPVIAYDWNYPLPG